MATSINSSVFGQNARIQLVVLFFAVIGNLGAATYVLREGNSFGTYTVSDEIYLTSSKGETEVYGKAKLVDHVSDGTRVLRFTNDSKFNLRSMEAEASSAEPNAKVGLVLYPKGLEGIASSRRFATNEVLIAVPNDEQAESARKLSQAISFDNIKPGRFYKLKFKLSSDALEAVTVLEAAGLKAEPLLARFVEKRAAPNDTLYGLQWHLKNTGQSKGIPGIDINVESVWDTNTGKDIEIVVIDGGMQLTQPDLVPNLLPSSAHFDFVDNDSDPNPDVTEDFHATSVAGVAAARGGNGLGVSGVAPEAKIASVRLITGGPLTDTQVANSLLWRNDVSQISNNSWGPSPDGYFLGFGSQVQDAFEECATQGRGGKGRITLFAAGNGGSSDNSNYDGVANSRYVIAVGAVTDEGTATPYSEPGTNILVCAPSGGGQSDIVTTDLVGSNGYNSGDLTLGLDYTNLFSGTSSACPAVSGVVALMLKANPNLGWRDVKEILLSTATRISASDPGWKQNGAGFFFNEFYGAGMVNAKLAVQTATGWANLPSETSLVSEKLNLNTLIPDSDPTGITVEFDLGGAGGIRAEVVELHVDITHPYIGDVDIELVSPSGMVSKLKRVNFNPQSDLDWTFSSVNYWGEDPSGVWKLNIRDGLTILAGRLNSATLSVYGATPRSNPPPRPPIVIIGGGGKIETAKQIINLSTRAYVGTANSVAIGGIIVGGSGNKRVMFRAIGPSLQSAGVADFLADPVLELYDKSGVLLDQNDDWKSGKRAQVEQSGLRPKSDAESCLIATLSPGNYTLVLKGFRDATGIALVEAYDLDGLAAARLANVSTRALVGTGDNVTIAGFIIQGDTERQVLLRGIGPSLQSSGITDALTDTTIELRDSTGKLIAQNDDWAETQQQEISSIGLQPTFSTEAAMIRTLRPGAYTCILRGKNNSSGVGLVEAYELR